jgi:hypothetical protein
MKIKLAIFLYSILSILTISSIVWLISFSIIDNIGIVFIVGILFTLFGIYLKNKTKYEILGYVILWTFTVCLFLTFGFFIYWILNNVRC